MDSGFTKKDILYLGLGAAALFLLYRLVTKGKEELQTGLDPTNPNNYANRIADKVTEGVTGEKGATIGNKLFDWLNPSAGTRIEVFYADGRAKLANGTILEKGWRVSESGMLYDRDGKLLGKAG